MLRIVQSNDFDLLAEHLLRHADRWPEADVFAAERLVVPSLGVARELSGRVARHRGICANVAFDFPAQFVWQLFARVLPQIPQHSPFDGDVMSLRLFGLLAELPDDAHHATLRDWLARHDAAGRIDLAQRISQLFQQYLAYRPDWLERWAQGERLGLGDGPEERWQQPLWQRMLAAEPVAGPRHPKNAVFAELERRRRAGLDLGAVLPAQIRVIGVPSLPPTYLDVLVRLARYTEVTIWFLNPCREFWADLQSPRVAAWRAARDSSPLPEVQHALLASWGRQVRDQFARFALLDGVAGADDVRVFVDRGHETLLARVQQSMLDLTPIQPFTARREDASLQLNVCHSLTRQLQVLHDTLLGWFADDETLAPDDVLVLLPDVDRAAEDIDAVFGGVPETRRIAYAISGLRHGTQGPYWTAWQGLLELLGGRFTASGVLDWLRQPPVAARFDLDETDLEMLARWVDDTGIRWGRDAAHRGELGLPADARHSWAAGIGQLLAGFAAPLQGRALLADLLPYDDIEGSQALVLGRVLRALATLDEAARAVAVDRPIEDWCARLAALAERTLAPELAQRGDAERLRAALAAIAADAAHCQTREPVPLAVVTRLLERQLDRGGPGGVPTGRVTFTGFGPLRGVPYRIVCALDMNSDDFPRDPRPLEFDLMNVAPRAGDRSRRDEDRGAFLDALLAARDRLWIAWNGRSTRDNQPLPPSVVTAELIDVLCAAADGGRDALLAACLDEHPLQPFHPRLFDPRAPRSFADEYRAAAEAVRRPAPLRDAPRPLLRDGPLPPAGDEWRDVTLDQLASFFRNPARALLRRRLGIELVTAGALPADSEPFLLDRSGQNRLRERLLDQALSARQDDDPLALLRAAPELPQGALGRSVLAAERQTLTPLIEALRARLPRPPLAPLAFARDIHTAHGVFRLSGSLAPLTADGLVFHDVADFRLHPLIDAWPRHLALNWLRPDGIAPRTWLLLGERTVHQLEPRDDAPTRLAALLEAYWEGLHAPLPFAPKAADAWLRAKPEKALDAAAGRWRGDDWNDGDAQDPWRLQVYGGVSELPPGFAERVEDLFGPLRAVLLA